MHPPPSLPPSLRHTQPPHKLTATKGNNVLNTGSHSTLQCLPNLFLRHVGAVIHTETKNCQDSSIHEQANSYMIRLVPCQMHVGFQPKLLLHVSRELQRQVASCAARTPGKVYIGWLWKWFATMRIVHT